MKCLRQNRPTIPIRRSSVYQSHLSFHNLDRKNETIRKIFLTCLHIRFVLLYSAHDNWIESKKSFIYSSIEDCNDTLNGGSIKDESRSFLWKKNYPIKNKGISNDSDPNPIKKVTFPRFSDRLTHPSCNVSEHIKAIPSANTTKEKYTKCQGSVHMNRRHWQKCDTIR